VPNAEDVIRRLHRTLLDARDPDAVDDLFAPQFESHNHPPGFPPGVEGVKSWFAMVRDTFPDVDVRIDQVVADGDSAAVATTISGTHAPTGRHVAVTGIDIIRVEDGRIVEHRGLTDTVGLTRQLAEGFAATSG
jgi:predicted SnoaL-like aldol condensation-catalyzing enzyme